MGSNNRFRVIFSRSLYQSGHIDVTAGDIDEAYEKAEQALSDGYVENWETEDYGDEEIDRAEELNANGNIIRRGLGTSTNLITGYAGAELMLR